MEWRSTGVDLYEYWHGISFLFVSTISGEEMVKVLRNVFFPTGDTFLQY